VGERCESCLITGRGCVWFTDGFLRWEGQVETAVHKEEWPWRATTCGRW